MLIVEQLYINRWTDHQYKNAFYVSHGVIKMRVFNNVVVKQNLSLNFYKQTILPSKIQKMYANTSYCIESAKIFYKIYM